MRPRVYSEPGLSETSVASVRGGWRCTAGGELDGQPGARQKVLQPDPAVFAAGADRRALGAATLMWRRSAFLDEIGITNTLPLRITVAGSALATAACASHRAAAVAGDLGHDDPHQFLGQQRAEALMVFVLLRQGWRCAKQNKCKQRDAGQHHSGAAVNMA